MPFFRRTLLGALCALAGAGCGDAKLVSTIGNDHQSLAIVSPSAGEAFNLSNDQSPLPGFQRDVVIDLESTSPQLSIELIATAGKTTSNWVQGPFGPGARRVTFSAVTLEPVDGSVQLTVVTRAGGKELQRQGLSVQLDTTPGGLKFADGTVYESCSDRADITVIGSDLPDQSPVALTVGGVELARSTMSAGKADFHVTLQPGANYVSAAALRASGNASVAPAKQFYVDRTGPVITAMQCDGDTNGDGAWSYDESPTFCEITLGDESADGQPITIDSNVAGESALGSSVVHGRAATVSISVKAPLQPTSRVFRAHTTDACGNPSVSKADLPVVVDGRQPHEVRVSMNGQGMVKSQWPDKSLVCEHDCVGSWLDGSFVELRAQPAAHYQLTAWEGCDQLSANVCQLTLNGDKKMSVTFSPIQQQLTLGVEGNGHIQVSPDNVSCATAQCVINHDETTMVTLVAVPWGNQAFIGWTGDCAGQSEVCRLTANQAQHAEAHFATIMHKVIVEAVGNGSIDVDGQPSCLFGQCEYTLPQGQEFHFYANPGPNQRLVGWLSGCSITFGAACDATVQSGLVVSAQFTSIMHTVQVSSVNGGGVQLDPGGDFCSAGSVCGYQHAQGSDLTATAIPSLHYRFLGWSAGACAGQAQSCTFELTGPTAVQASFEMIQHQVLTDTAGSGDVVANLLPQSCSKGRCSYLYDEGTIAELTAVPRPNQRFVAWIGACAGQTEHCLVQVDQPVSTVAAFEEIMQPLTISVGNGGSVMMGSTVCSAGSSCSHEVYQGTDLTLIAVASSGMQFDSWSGACAGQGSTCTITDIQQATSVGVSFSSAGHTLSVVIDGNGSLRSLDGQIDCGSTCSASVSGNVRLIATPAHGQIVASWTGCSSTSGATCDAAMNADTTVTVHFGPAPAGWIDACAEAGMVRTYDGYYDDWNDSGSLPFPFTFGGTTYNDYGYSTNGVFFFGAGAGNGQFSNQPLPVAGFGPALFPYWDDLVTTAGNGICRATVGSPGSQKFVVTWSKMGFWNEEPGAAMTFSLILDEAAQTASFSYFELSSPGNDRASGTSATVGMQTDDSTATQFSYETPSLTAGQLITY